MPTYKNKCPKRFEALDALRGICAVCVVVFHMHLILQNTVTTLPFFRGSALFVDFFFVLSGFVLTHGYSGKSIGFVEFMKKRFFRLYPLHFFMLLVFITIELFNETQFTGRNAISEIIPNLLLVQAWLPFANPLSFNGVSWSISIEFYTYALFFLSIALFRDYLYLLTMCWSAFSLSAFLFIYFEIEIPTLSALRGLSCFFGGAMAYVFYKKVGHIKKTSRWRWSLAETAISALVIFIVSSDIAAKNIMASIVFIVAVLIFSLEAGVISQWLKEALFQYIGRLSYSIYMTHAAILLVLGNYCPFLRKSTGAQLADCLIVFSLLLVVIFISNLTYQYIEVPGQKLMRDAKSASAQPR